MTVPQTSEDTKNTAGALNTSNKIYLVGATSQATSAITTSHDTCYVDTDGYLYNGVATSNISTNKKHRVLTGEVAPYSPI